MSMTEVDSYEGATPLPVGRPAAPFTSLPAEMRRRIAEAVLDPKPPKRWLELNGGLVQIQSRAWLEWHWHRGVDPESRRSRLPTWMRERVIERDGPICQLCGGDVEPHDIHIDHIFPVAFGGKDELANLQVTHSLCNMRKGART